MIRRYSPGERSFRWPLRRIQLTGEPDRPLAQKRRTETQNRHCDYASEGAPEAPRATVLATNDSALLASRLAEKKRPESRHRITTFVPGPGAHIGTSRVSSQTTRLSSAQKVPRWHACRDGRSVSCRLAVDSGATSFGRDRTVSPTILWLSSHESIAGHCRSPLQVAATLIVASFT